MAFETPVGESQLQPCEFVERRTWRGRSSSEELANSLSHGVGLVAAAIGTPLLLISAWRSGNAAFFTGAIIFTTTMLMVYFISALYHAWPESSTKSKLQLLDHCAIFLLIAGTYTPFSLGPLHGVWGSAILITIWILAVLGIIIKTIRGPSRDRRTGVFLYLGMGWLALVFVRPVFLQLPAASLHWLFAGGIAYTAGVLFFINERMRYAHFVWHLFVLTGTSCHFLAVLACT